MEPTQLRLSVTPVLVAINVGVFLLMAVAGVSLWSPTGEELVRWGAAFGPYVLGAQPWRLLTAMFVHIGVLHIVFNMICLASLGPVAEHVFGWRKYLAIYLLSGLAAGVVSVALHPGDVGAGASGAIFGVAGALVSSMYLRNIPALLSIRGRMSKRSLVGFVLYNLVWGATHTGIDNAAHVGGLASGLLIGLTIPIPLAGSLPGRVALRRSGFVFATGLVLIAAAFLGVRRLRAPHGYAAIMSETPVWSPLADPAGPIFRPVEPTHPEDVVREAQKSLRAHPDDSTSLALLGSAFYELKQWAQAVDAFTRYTRIDSNNAAVWANLGDAYLQWGHAEDAVQPLVRATALAPDDESFQYLLGTAYLDAEQYALAVGAFDKVLKRAPDNPLVLEKRRQAERLLAGTRQQ